MRSFSLTLGTAVAIALTLGAAVVACTDEDSTAGPVGAADASLAPSNDGGSNDPTPLGDPTDAGDASTADGSTSARPGVSLTLSTGVVTEAPASEVGFVLTLDRDPPAGGVRVYVRGDVSQSLSQLDLLSLTTDPASSEQPVGDLDFSGFTLLLTSRTVRVVLKGFADGVVEAPATVRYSIVPFDQVPWGLDAVDDAPAAAPYTVVGAASTLELRDAP